MHNVNKKSNNKGKKGVGVTAVAGRGKSEAVGAPGAHFTRQDRKFITYALIEKERLWV